MAGSCETVKEDSLTIYKSSGRRFQQLKVPTKNSQSIMDLPSTIAKSSLLVLFDSARMVPHEIKGSQLVMDMPSGYVKVEDKDGRVYEGTLESLSGSEASIRDKVTGALVQIPDFKSVDFTQRFRTRNVMLSYLLGGLSWIPKHTLIIDSAAERVSLFKTTADVTNNTGIIFNLTSLKLGVGNPQVILSEPQPYSIRAGVSAPMMSAMALPAASARESKREFKSVNFSKEEEEESHESEHIAEFNTIEDGGVEDYGSIDLGRQTLREHGNFDILTMKDMPIKKVYFFEIEDHNNYVELGYKMILDKNVHIPAGRITLYGLSKEGNLVGEYIGTTTIHEQRQQDEMDIKLGGTTVVRAECIVNKVKENKESPTLASEDIEDLGDIDPRDVGAALEFGSLEYPDPYSLGSRIRQLPSQLAHPGLIPYLEDINVLLKKDVPKILHTSIDCTFTNNSSESPAFIIARYPVPQKQKMLDMTCKPSRIKDGFMEFNIVVPPSKKVKFACEIVTQLSQ